MATALKRIISFCMVAVMLLGVMPWSVLHVHAEENSTEQKKISENSLISQTEPIALIPLYREITVTSGQLIGDTGEIVDNEIYGYIVGYELKKGHTLSISNKNYVFSVRKLENSTYSNMLKQATTANFTASEDMTVGMLIRKADKSALTAEELESVVIYDSQYGMIGVEGYAHRFTVEAETIEGSTHTTRSTIFLPNSYTENGDATPLIIMTNGYSAHLTDSVWNTNSAENVGVMNTYLSAGYAVLVVDNTAERTSNTPDLGCPQLVDSYLKAHAYVTKHLNVEEKFSIHSRSFGTFAAVRLMLEVPELINCGVMTGPRVSLKYEWGGLDKAFIANRFGFEDTTGATYEADKLIGYNPYIDVDAEEYKLPPTFWMLAEGDATERPTTYINKLVAHGNTVNYKTYADISHTGICTLNSEQTAADALAFMKRYQSLAGKTISILGASISTYAGTSNGAAADTTNSTIRNNAKYYPNNTVKDVALGDTWWMQVVNDLGLRLLVNNSWSGGAILLERAGTVGAYVDRCVQLHDNTGENAGEDPDIIIIQKGFNDFSYGKSTLGTAEDINYDELILEDGYAVPKTTMEATVIMLDKMTKRYPNAEIYMFSHFRRVNQSAADTELMEKLNASIETVCERYGVKVIDLYSVLGSVEFVGDGSLHPNRLGMDIMTEAFKRALLENTAFSVKTHTVSMKLDHVTADYGDDKIVVDGDAFTLKLAAANHLQVKVTMGGKDITEDCYANGTITIAAVTAYVTIDAKNVYEPQNYRWEFDGTDLTSAGQTENTLTKTAGTTTDGVFSKTSYALGNAVCLMHDLPWIVEWKCEGTFLNENGSSGARIFTSDAVNAHYNARYIFKSNTNGLIAMGEKTSTGSHNYGIALKDYGIDWTALHTYRLENRVAQDGSNMIWLYVDGQEIGSLTNYYVGTTNKNTTSDWLSGKDFVFPYMGTDTHGFTNCEIEYIKVWENGEPEPAENLWEGKSAVFVGDSITAGTGTTKLYYQFLKESLGLGSVTAMGVGGSCISAASDYGQKNQPLINRYQNIPSADLIVVFMGTNDYGHETPLGAVSDAQDGTFYGALNIIVPTLVEMHPSSKIVFVTSMHRYGFGTSKILGTKFTYDNIPNGVGATLGDYVNAVKTVCASNGVSVIDLYTKCTLDPSDSDIRAAYIPDGIHPNAAGHEVIAGIMKSHILRYTPSEKDPIEQSELIYGNKFATGYTQTCRASSRVSYYLKAGTVITLKDPATMQWACAKTPDEAGSKNLGYFPDNQWTDKTTAVVESDGWVGFVFKYRDETKSFDLTRPLSDYITIEEPHVHSYESAVTPPTCTEQGYMTHTCTVCGDSYVDSYTDAKGHSYSDNVCTMCGVHSWDTDGDGALEILAIGNSFSVDALEYFWQIADNLGIEEIVIGNLYIGGCSLQTHAANAKGDLGKYTYYHNESGTWTSTASTKISTALAEREWDYITLQQVSSYSGVESTYNEDLTYMIGYVKERSEAKLGWHMTWAYQQNSTHTAFPNYNSDQMTMYNAIVSAVKNKILTNEEIDFIIPAGTAVQNSRTSPLGDTTTRDGYHMSYDYGRYLTGLTWFRTLTGLPVDGITYAPAGVDQDEMAIAFESVNNAHAKPFEVTKSTFTYEVPEGYVLLEPTLYKGAYWNSDFADGYNVLHTDKGNSKQFFATPRFTKENLPVGSIIVVENGWQYRPEGWIEDECQTGREDVTAKSFVRVTEEWWGDYTLRAFNISKIGLPSLANTAEAEVRAAFKIYVPKDMHVHNYATAVMAPTCTEQGYTTHTCATCGDSYVDGYVEATGHSYSGTTCTTCGEEHPNAADYKDKVISILSASTSTFAGYIPVADGFNLEHRPRYPQDNLLTDVNETWWMQTITELGAKLGINDSWAGSQVLNTLDKNSGDLGPDAAMASLTRIKNLGANGTPDVILFFGAGNDMGRGVPAGSFDPATAPTEVDLTTTKWDTLADAYVAAIMRLKYFYPDAKIIAMSTYAMPSYVTQAKLDKYGPILEAICEYYGVEYLSLRDCGVTYAMLPDNIHPNAEGMDHITEAVVEKLLCDVEIEAGENKVYSVTHDLKQATASLSYYKGISAGNSFEETLGGENVTVSVIMGGVDITDSCCADGRIYIARVTGDLVITVKGAFTADGHLQQLPEQLCPGTNLWQVLVPENIYYTVSGWGNTTAGTSWSITFPVKEGDRIWATSLGAYPGNGSGANGVRVTWFDENGVLQTISRDVVYAEFAKYGYITAPEGAVALNLPMTNNQEHYAVYILSAEHEYEGTVTPPTCTEQGYTTYTCATCGDTYVSDYVAALGHTEVIDSAIKENSARPGWTDGSHCDICGEVIKEQIEIPAKGYDWMLDDGEFKLLLIGNSYSQDASSCGQGMKQSQLFDILQAMLGEDVKVTVALLYSGGKGINWHATQADRNQAAYGFSVITSDNPTWKSYGSYTSANALAWTDWDVVSLQTYNPNPKTGQESVPYPDTTDEKFYSLEIASEYMLDHIANNAPYADVYFYMHWAQTSSTTLNAALSNYNKTAAYIPVVMDFAGMQTGNQFTTIIPVGLSIQNARSTYLALLRYNTTAYADGNLNLTTDAQIGLQRDGGHVSFNIGRYIAGLTFAEMIVPESMRAEGYVLPDIRVTESVGKLPKEYTTIAQLSVWAAVNSWKSNGSLAVTEIEGHAEDPTVAAGKLLQGTTVQVPCGAGVEQISTAILAALPADFAVESVTLADGTTVKAGASFTCEATIRFGYTFLTVNVNCVVDAHDHVPAVTAPTCTEQGYTTHTCACGDTYTDTYVDALGHNYSDWYATVEPTCTEKGIERRDCDACDHFETREIKATGHSYDAVVTKPTCTEKGYTTHTCHCGESYVDSYVNALGHSFGTWVVTSKPTCTTTGVERRDCDACDHFETREIKATGHSYDAVVTKPTCTEKGYTTHTCHCGESYVDSYVNALGHSFGTWVVTTKPTCTTTGEERRDCDACEHFETREIKATGHSYDAVVTKPTCTEKGYTTHTCHCGESYVDSFVNALGHNFGTWVVTTKPTCTEKGTERRDCDACDHFETREIKATGHSYNAVVTTPTCTEQGYTTHTCHCGESYVDSYVNALGHSFGAWVVTSEPTCTEKGTERRDCDACDHFETREIKATGHSYSSIVTKPTCTEKGYTTHTCHCGESYVDSFVNALGHHFGTWVVTTKPTCEKVGEERRDCDACDHFETHEIKALGHDTIKHSAQSATCTEIGWNAYETCSRCDYSTYVEIPATGHNYDSVVTKPTCEEKGYTTHTCHCGESYVDSYVNALGHSYEAAVTEPTCTEYGFTIYTCHCGDSYVGSYVSALGHSFDEWKTTTEPTCTENGEESRECSICAHVETREIKALGHSYNVVVTDPTCTEHGYTTHTCHCGDSYVDGYVKPLGHAYGDWYQTKAPTENEPGEKRRDCSHCGGFETSPIAELGHDHSRWETIVLEAVAPTCTKTGLTEGSKCSKCGEILVAQEIIHSLGHDFGEWTETKSATCTEDGTERRECDRCDHFETRTIKASGHSYNAVVTHPTCTEKGYTTHTCQCGDSYVDSYVEAIGHTFGKWREIEEATCEQAGKERRECDACDHFETREIKATGHNYNSVVTKPTCEEKGYTTHTCHCGESYVDSYVSALGHSFGAWVVTTKPTCEKVGEERRDCDACDHFEAREIKATGHSYDAVVTKPTCTEQGYTTHTCHCGDSYVDSYVGATGHTFGEWAETAAPSCTEAGEERRECTACDHFETRIVEATDHSYDSVVTQPTCTEQGYTTHTCECGDSYVDSYVNALGHSFGAWVVTTKPTCTAVGEERRDCDACDHFETREIGKRTHEYHCTVTPPTCTEKGYTTHTCQCGESYVDSHVDAIGHVYDNDRDATCNACDFVRKIDTTAVWVISGGALLLLLILGGVVILTKKIQVK